jgi:hypothetical protein
MTLHGPGLASVSATEGKARKDDQVDASISFPNSAPATDTQAEPQNGADQFYSPKPIKRQRRTKAAVTSIRDTIKQLLEESHPQTVRQIFYALTVKGAIAKHEGEYKQTVIRLLVDMREAGVIPFNWIADNTRWMRKPATFTGLESCLNSTSKFYRRDLWATMPVYLEVWCEKDALAGVLM